MPSTPIFVFECVDNEYFALTKELNGLRHLKEDFAQLRWHLRRRLRASESGAAHFQAAKTAAGSRGLPAKVSGRRGT